MKTLTFALPLLLSLTLSGPCFGQEHCIPLDESRWLHEQALKASALDSLVHYQGKQITLLQESNESLTARYSGLLATANDRLKDQKEITLNMENLANGWRDEATYYQKRYKKQRNQKGILTAGVVVLIGLIILK